MIIDMEDVYEVLPISLAGAIIMLGVGALIWLMNPGTPEDKVVEIHITRAEKPVQNDGLKIGKKTVPLGHGTCSGEFVSSTGDILTAKHCTDGAISFEVVTSDSQHYNAVVVKESQQYDLSLMRIAKRNTPFFKLAKEVIRGETVYALGSPLAITSTLSKGIVAKLDGDITLLDLSVLPGNSGCPIYNESGKLVGVAVAGFIVGLGTTHLNLAQSIESVRDFLEENGI